MGLQNNSTFSFLPCLVVTRRLFSLHDVLVGVYGVGVGGGWRVAKTVGVVEDGDGGGEQ